MAATAGLDQTDDASALSYFQKTVCLHDWWLVKSDREFEGKRLAVAGSTAREKQAVRLFSSAPIVKRYDFSTMETADGICVVISGLINKLRTQENGFPSMVGSHFVLGFPTDWEEYATKFTEGDSTNGIHSGTISDSAIAGKEKSCPTSEQTPNNHEQVNHRSKLDVEALKGNLKNNAGSGCSMKLKREMLSPKPETFKNPDGAKQNSSSGVTIQSEGIMDISDNVPDHSVGQISGNLSEVVRSKREDEKWTVSGLKSPTSEQTPNNHEQVIHKGSPKNSPGSGCSTKHKNKMLSPKTKTFENPDEAKLNSSSGVTIQPEGIMDISDNVPDHSVGQILGNLSENVRSKGEVEKWTVSGLKRESIKMNSVPVASGNMSEILQNHNFEFEDNNISSSSTYVGKSDAKERANKKKTKRNLMFDQTVSRRSQERKNKKSIVSPESLSYGRSRSGKLLIPTMEFWRNQLPVYDADRKITGIMTEKRIDTRVYLSDLHNGDLQNMR
ncbi:hypothetical protein SO802_030267 [Lithocarpus litseifolius]|uniref:SANTA domain-containing protein n=1 Tax=Lithocarpus litseifolius TaxID=425828 RepID=A0AAW2BJ63_9ROSI